MSFDPNLVSIFSADYHRNGVAGVPFKVALVDDANDGDMKLVVMFEAEGHTAVLSVNKIMQDDVQFGSNSYRGDLYEEALRPELWSNDSEDAVTYE
jgi:hypothetical protein